MNAAKLLAQALPSLVAGTYGLAGTPMHLVVALVEKRQHVVDAQLLRIDDARARLRELGHSDIADGLVEAPEWQSRIVFIEGNAIATGEVEWKRMPGAGVA